MLRRHGPAMAATMTMAFLVAALVISAFSPASESTALPKVITSEPRTTRVDAKVGEEVWLTWSGTFALGGDARAIVTAVELIKVQPGLRVTKLKAVNQALGAPQPPARQYFTGPMPSTYKTRALVPVTTVVLEPGETNEHVYFIARVTADKPGIYRLEGWRMLYQAGLRNGESTYEHRLEFRVT